MVNIQPVVNHLLFEGYLSTRVFMLSFIKIASGLQVPDTQNEIFIDKSRPIIRILFDFYPFQAKIGPVEVNSCDQRKYEPFCNIWLSIALMVQQLVKHRFPREPKWKDK